jgi:hypothetical protein
MAQCEKDCLVDYKRFLHTDSVNHFCTHTGLERRPADADAGTDALSCTLNVCTASIAEGLDTWPPSTAAGAAVWGLPPATRCERRGVRASYDDGDDGAAPTPTPTPTPTPRRVGDRGCDCDGECDGPPPSTAASRSEKSTAIAGGFGAPSCLTDASRSPGHSTTDRATDTPNVDDAASARRWPARLLEKDRAVESAPTDAPVTERDETLPRRPRLSDADVDAALVDVASSLSSSHSSDENWRPWKHVRRVNDDHGETSPCHTVSPTGLRQCTLTTAAAVVWK